jgi:ABC-type amino acid transport substrate-binding protein
VPDARIVVLPDPPSALAAVEAGRIDAYAGTALTVQDLLSRSASTRVERATPFTDPVIDGRPVRGYGAFALRREDRALDGTAQRAARRIHRLHAASGTGETLRLHGGRAAGRRHCGCAVPGRAAPP